MTFFVSYIHDFSKILFHIFSANSSTADSTVQYHVVPKQASTEAVLNEFKIQDKFIPYDTFNDFIGVLDKYRNESNLTGGLELAHEVKAHLINTMNAYYVSTQSMYQWCDVAIDHFQSYIQQLQDTTKDEAMEQHHTLVQMLEEELEKISMAQQKLHELRLSFDEISEVKLTPRLDKDFDNYSAQSNQQIKLLNSDIMDKMSVLLNLWDSNGVRHLKSKIREIKENLVTFKVLNDELKEAIKQAEYKANEMKTNFEDEINAMAHVRSLAQITLSTINSIIEEDAFDPEINNIVEVAVGNLIKKCKEYRARHGPHEM